MRADAPQLRSTIIEAADQLARFDPRWHELGQKLRAAGKPSSVTIAAVANRLIRWLFHRMQEDVTNVKTSA